MVCSPTLPKSYSNTEQRQSGEREVVGTNTENCPAVLVTVPSEELKLRSTNRNP